jgi:DHA1 family tetracycline resistance protein-like MFS transporter
MQSRVLFFVFVTVLLDMIGFGIVIPLLPFYVQSMGGSAEVVGLLLGSFAFTQMIATPLLGRMSDRYGRRPIILASLAGNAIAMVVFAIAADHAWLPLLFVSRIMAGATAGNLAACQAAVADVTSGPERAAGMGRIGAGIGLGLVIGPVLGSTVSRLHPNAPPLAAGVLAFVDLVGVYFLMPETRAGAAGGTIPPAQSWRALGRALVDPQILSIMAIYFLTFICMTNVQVSLALLAAERLGWTANDVGHLFGLYGLMALLVQGGAIGRLSRRYAAVNVLVGGTIAIGCGMAGMGSAHSAMLLLGGVALAGLGAGLTNPTLASLASQYAGAGQQGAILGFAQSAGGAARTVGPVWSGFLYARLGASAPFFSGVLAATLSLAVALALRRRTLAAAARATTDDVVAAPT